MRLRKLLPILLFSLLTLLLSFAPAAAYDLWKGDFSFTATAYHKDEASGKLVKTSEPVSGTAEI